MDSHGRRPSARDLAAERSTEERNRARMFEEVVQKAFDHIRERARRRATRTVYTVPRMVVGMPVYDIGACVRYTVRKLRTSGYYVEIYPPNVLYVSWDKSEIDA